MVPGRALRAYQAPVARAVGRSVAAGGGEQFAVVFSRQAGKDETLAQVLAWLLVRYQRSGGTAVVAAPTLRPQAMISRDRLVGLLRATPATARRFRVRDGTVVELGAAAVRFLSAGPDANARGATASLLLVANEAQDIDPARWDAVFDPMAASTNASTVYMGTVWDQHGLLARQMRHLAATAPERVYRVPWGVVAAELPAYGERVRARIAQFGPEHPFIRTEYDLIELDAEAGLLPPARLAQLRGDHPRRHRGEPGKTYALLVDVAGEEEDAAGPGGWESGAKRDATALTVVEVERGAGLPVYRVVDRRAWTGARFGPLAAQVEDLARNVWRARAVVVDATGIGAGLASMLADRLGRGPGALHVEPFVFTGASKSKLGWDWLGLIDGGRLKEYADDGDELTRAYWAELASLRYEVLPGPGRLLRWGAPAPGHDDLAVSCALVAALDAVDWRPRTARGTAGPG